MLPNFLIIGAMKAGTTSLYSYLKSHPEIFMPANKEPCFFSNKEVWDQGIQWYSKLFNSHSNSKARGEASVNYTKYPHYKNVPERIYSYVPDMKLIYVLRSPVERIYSHYLHNVYAGSEKDTFDVAIKNKPLYIQTSLYYKQISEYLKYFDREQLHVVILDDMKKNALNVVQKIFNFLGVEASYVPPNINLVRHKTQDKRGVDNKLMMALRRFKFYHSLSEHLPDNVKSFAGSFLKNKIESMPEKMTHETRQFLINEVQTDTEKLSDFLKRDLGSWNCL